MSRTIDTVIGSFAGTAPDRVTNGVEFEWDFPKPGGGIITVKLAPTGTGSTVVGVPPQGGVQPPYDTIDRVLINNDVPGVGDWAEFAYTFSESVVLSTFTHGAWDIDGDPQDPNLFYGEYLIDWSLPVASTTNLNNVMCGIGSDLESTVTLTTPNTPISAITFRLGTTFPDTGAGVHQRPIGNMSLRDVYPDLDCAASSWVANTSVQPNAVQTVTFTARGDVAGNPALSGTGANDEQVSFTASAGTIGTVTGPNANGVYSFDFTAPATDGTVTLTATGSKSGVNCTKNINVATAVGGFIMSYAEVFLREIGGAEVAGTRRKVGMGGCAPCTIAMEGGFALTAANLDAATGYEIVLEAADTATATVTLAEATGVTVMTTTRPQ